MMRAYKKLFLGFITVLISTAITWKNNVMFWNLSCKFLIYSFFKFQTNIVNLIFVYSMHNEDMSKKKNWKLF